MSAQPSKLPPESTPATPAGGRIVLHVPDVSPADIPPDLPALFARPSVPRTRGMEVLQRVLARRSGLFSILTRPNRWQNRLWLATFSLIGVSCCMLVIGMKQSPRGHTVHAGPDAVLAEEFEDDFNSPEEATEVRHVAAYHAAPVAGDHSLSPGASVIQPVGYETPQSAPPRGAWLEGTIQPDDTEE